MTNKVKEKEVLWWEDWDDKLDVMNEDVDKRMLIFNHLKEINSICNSGISSRYNREKYEAMRGEIKTIIRRYGIGWLNCDDNLKKN